MTEYEKRLAKVEEYQKNKINNNCKKAEFTRELANSSFSHKYLKAPFAQYGQGNTIHDKRLLEDNYMKTHSVNPDNYENHPERKQVYEEAERKRKNK